jgi:hypothetical protein
MILFFHGFFVMILFVTIGGGMVKANCFLWMRRFKSHFGHLIIVSYITKPNHIDAVRRKKLSKLIEIIKNIQQKGFRL